MKNTVKTHGMFILLLSMVLSLLSACSDDNNDTDVIREDITNQSLSEADKAALLFMFEEEKLARDTYVFLNDLWSINQFANIQKSEEKHMNAVENLLVQNNIEYTIFPIGEFKNQDLQNFYNQFVINGAFSKANAFHIGATIEDLDIKDLQAYLDITTHPDLIAVFESLQCGSRNHLKSFVLGIENGGNIYTPQFLTQVEYDNIIQDNRESCN
jgi:hypothetical protein